MVMERRHGAIDRNLVEIWTPQADQLRIRVGEETTLQKRIASEIDARHDMAWVKSDLLGLREEIIGVTVEGQLADVFDRDQFFGNDFGGVEQIEVKCMFVLFLDDLHAELPFRVVAVLNGFP